MTIVDRDLAIAALEEQWAALLALADDLAPAEWLRPTACPGWSVQDNFSHCLGIEAMLVGRPTPAVSLPDEMPHVRNDMGRANEAWVEAYRAKSPAEVVGELHEVVAERRAALAAMDQAAFDAASFTPAGPDTYGRLMRARVMDLWFHEQDVREATGRPGRLVGLAPELALDEVVTALGYVIGKKAGVRAGVAVRFELTGDLARRIDIDVAERARVVDALAGDPTATLTLPGERFMRIAGGRVPSGSDLGADIDGDTALGEQVMANLAFMI
ncbi:MAG: maleylpyruvate isomerase family mycothiol-dependent enzyme [Acidimicrobiales bacterium]